MNKEGLLKAVTEAIVNKNQSVKKYDRIEILSNNNNDLYVDRKEPFTGGLYLGDMGYNYLIGVKGSEEHKISKEEYENLIKLFDDNDSI